MGANNLITRQEKRPQTFSGLHWTRTLVSANRNTRKNHKFCLFFLPFLYWQQHLANFWANKTTWKNYMTWRVPHRFNTVFVCPFCFQYATRLQSFQRWQWTWVAFFFLLCLLSFVRKTQELLCFAYKLYCLRICCVVRHSIPFRMKLKKKGANRLWGQDVYGNLNI